MTNEEEINQLTLEQLSLAQQIADCTTLIEGIDHGSTVLIDTAFDKEDLEKLPEVAGDLKEAKRQECLELIAQYNAVGKQLEGLL